ncbi:MAG: fused MFS/spermidine synthase [Chloroflexota bacterium]
MAERIGNNIDTEQTSRGNGYLYLLVFTSGMATLAIELTASRLLGYVFGNSNLVWANIIGLMLLYLTVGYFIGGRWADKSPKRSTMYTIALWGAFLSAFVPLVGRPVLTISADAFQNFESALALGSFVSVLVLFSVPVTLLGTMSPFAIRLAVTDVENAGRVSGQIYALSTVGSILGTFLPTLYFIPEWGTTATFLVFSGTLFVVAGIGLLLERQVKTVATYSWMILVIGALIILIDNRPLRPAIDGFDLLYEGESAYNYIQVQEDPNGYRYLFLNEGQGVHSQWHPTNIYYQRTWDFFLAAPYFNADFAPDEMQSMLVVGLATGTIPRQHIAVYGDIPIDGVEIDPDIIEVGEDFFQMNETHMPSLTMYAQDGRYVLNQLDREYTVIGIDAYRPPYIPWHLTTVEFFQEVQAHLADDGVMVINVGRTETDRRLVDALTNTLYEVFPTVHAIDVPSAFNTILVATNQPTVTENLNANLASLPDDAHPMLRQVLMDTTANIVEARRSDILFTDDRAPVETIIDSLVLNFILSGGAEDFR